jgi:hypothetical protein
MPAGFEATEPLPAVVTPSVYSGVNVAPTECVAFIVTVQVGDDPAQSPLHPVNVEPVAAVAVSVTTLSIS